MEPCSAKQKATSGGSQSPLLQKVRFGRVREGPLGFLYGPSLLTSLTTLLVHPVHLRVFAPALGSQGAKDLLSPLAV